MDFQKMISQLQLELLALAVFALAYLMLRYLILRRPIKYPEYERWFLIGIVIAAVLLLIFFIFR